MATLIAFSTTSSLREAQKIAKALIHEKVAACVNICPQIESHYVWKGKKMRAKEVLLIIKTREKLYQKLEKTLKKYHSYDVPELVAVPVQKGSRDYLSWIRKSLT